MHDAAATEGQQSKCCWFTQEGNGVLLQQHVVTAQTHPDGQLGARLRLRA